jgi:hypothetical protein
VSAVRRAAVLAAVLSALLSGLALGSPAHGATSRKVSLEFRPVLTQVPPVAATSSTTAPVGPVARATVASCDVAAVQAMPVVPTTASRAARSDACVVYPDRSAGANAARYYLGPAVDVPIRAAKAKFVSGQGWTVQLALTKAGSTAWDGLGEQQFHQQVAVVHDGFVEAAPVIEPNDQTFSSFGGSAVISSDFTRQEARALAAAVRVAKGR